MSDAKARDRPLPPTLDDFLRAIELARSANPPRSPLTYELAAALGALHHCDVGDEPILDIERLSDELLSRYHAAKGRRREIEEAIRRSGLEVGDVLSPNYCSYHGQITSE